MVNLGEGTIDQLRLGEMGIPISRRTVAKYREAMGIPGASGRKQY